MVNGSQFSATTPRSIACKITDIKLEKILRTREP
jgi:hypothetical protein